MALLAVNPDHVLEVALDKADRMADVIDLLFWGTGFYRFLPDIFEETEMIHLML